MVEVAPLGAPYPKAVLGWDGTAFRVFTVDSSGHVQIDVLSTVMDAAAAADATVQEVSDRLGAIGTPALNTANDLLQKIRDRLGALSNPDAGSVNKLLTDALTALQLIDDLQSALESEDTNALQVRGRDQLFSFKGEYGERINSTTGAAGTRLVNATNPSVGEIWVVTTIMAFNISSVCSLIRVGVAPGGTGIYTATNIPTIAREGCSWAGWVPMLRGTWAHAEFRDCGLNDNLYLDVSGFKMTLEA